MCAEPLCPLFGHPGVLEAWCPQAWPPGRCPRLPDCLMVHDGVHPLHLICTIFCRMLRSQRTGQAFCSCVCLQLSLCTATGTNYKVAEQRQSARAPVACQHAPCSRVPTCRCIWAPYNFLQNSECCGLACRCSQPESESASSSLVLLSPSSIMSPAMEIRLRELARSALATDMHS